MSNPKTISPEQAATVKPVVVKPAAVEAKPDPKSEVKTETKAESKPAPEQEQKSGQENTTKITPQVQNRVQEAKPVVSPTPEPEKTLTTSQKKFNEEIASITEEQKKVLPDVKIIRARMTSILRTIVENPDTEWFVRRWIAEVKKSPKLLLRPDRIIVTEQNQYVFEKIFVLHSLIYNKVSSNTELNWDYAVSILGETALLRFLKKR
jgi:hypothetical protein